MCRVRSTAVTAKRCRARRFGRSRGRRSQTVGVDCLTVCHPRDRARCRSGAPPLSLSLSLSLCLTHTHNTHTTHTHTHTSHPEPARSVSVLGASFDRLAPYTRLMEKRRPLSLSLSLPRPPPPLPLSLSRSPSLFERIFTCPFGKVRTRIPCPGQCTHFTPHPTPYTLHPAPTTYTVHPTPYTVHQKPKPYFVKLNF